MRLYEEPTRAKETFTNAGAQDICTTGESSTTKESKATDHAARPSEAAFSHARPWLLKQALRLRERGRRDTSYRSKPISNCPKTSDSSTSANFRSVFHCPPDPRSDIEALGDGAGDESCTDANPLNRT